MSLRIALLACNLLPTQNNSSSSDSSANAVSSDITGSVTWTTGNTYHVTSSIYVKGNLTIQPGVTVAVDPQVWIDVQAGATLSAVGTASEPIIFTSASTAAPGTWQQLYLDSGSNATTLAYCEFKYGGYGNHSVVELSNAKAAITYCTFDNNLGGAIDASSAGTGTSTMTHNTFYANGAIPVIINDVCTFDATNVFHASGSATSYAKNAVEFSGDMTSGRTLDITEVPYYFPGSFYVKGSVTVNAGVTMKFASDIWMDISSGATFHAVGTSASPVVFTSFKDDAALGDTNGDSTSSGAPGDWQQLYLDSGSNGTTLTYCTFKYGGYNNNYVIAFSDASADIVYCTLTNNLYGGIDALNAVSPTTLTNNSASNNAASASGPWDYNINSNPNVTASNNTGLTNP